MEKTRQLGLNENVPPINPEIEADLLHLTKSVWEVRDVAASRPKFRGKLC